ncbi:hypothetical protein EWM64_g8121 [Hericium alpestre]|uniref:Uncharacterized protein n=1 Tax=Hericium alpestre TaxID=135208 RepID=A0A4Y9ZNQ1_9AGAM|nr:hypothetical protein EWM64_g8121 [Hericium alpestre]
MTASSLFPAASTAPHAFSLFGQSPRDTYAMYEDLHTTVTRSSGRSANPRQRSTSGNSVKSGLKKMFGAF